MGILYRDFVISVRSLQRVRDVECYILAVFCSGTFMSVPGKNL